MRTSRAAALPPARLPAFLRVSALAALLLSGACAPAAAQAPRLVVVLYPTDNDGSPGNREADHGIRSTFFASGAGEAVEVENEYLDVTRFPDPGYQGHLAEFLRQKYAPRKIDLVIAGAVLVAGFRGEIP